MQIFYKIFMNYGKKNYFGIVINITSNIIYGEYNTWCENFFMCVGTT